MIYISVFVFIVGLMALYLLIKKSQKENIKRENLYKMQMIEEIKNIKKYYLLTKNKQNEKITKKKKD